MLPRGKTKTAQLPPASSRPWNRHNGPTQHSAADRRVAMRQMPGNRNPHGTGSKQISRRGRNRSRSRQHQEIRRGRVADEAPSGNSFRENGQHRTKAESPQDRSPEFTRTRNTDRRSYRPEEEARRNEQDGLTPRYKIDSYAEPRSDRTGNTGLRKRRVLQDQRLQTRLLAANMNGEANDTPRCRRYSLYLLNTKEPRYAKEDRNCPLEQLL